MKETTQETTKELRPKTGILFRTLREISGIPAFPIELSKLDDGPITLDIDPCRDL